MGKQFNIKDEETARLAREIATRKGKSVTATIRELLEQERARLLDEREARIQAIRQIAEDFRKKMPPDWRNKTSKEIMDDIYDENGLPI